MNALPEGWVETSLGEVSHYASGKIPVSEIDLDNYISTENLLADKMGVTQAATMPKVSKVNVFEVGDTLFSNIRTYFKKVWYSDKSGGASNDVLVFRPVDEEQLDKKYLYYLISNDGFIDYTVTTAKGTKMPRGDKDAIKQYPLNLPPLPEQKAIADMLSSFDEKIELLREQNKTLETLAQTIFKEWFVNFNYPDATAEMVDSELGETPKGWRVGKLSEAADFLNGLALQKYPPIEGKGTLPVIKIRELKQGLTANTDRANTELNKKYVIDNGDILFSWSGSLEVVIWKYGQGALNQHLFKVSSEVYPKWFYYYWTLFHLREFRVIAANKATTMGHIQRKHLDEAKVLIPSDDIMKQGTSLFSPIIEKIIITNEQIQNLSKTRDVLLPKLMSGLVRVII